MEAFTLDLGLDTLAVWGIADHRKHRADQSDKFGTLTWLCVIESCLYDVVGERITKHTFET